MKTPIPRGVVIDTNEAQSPIQQRHFINSENWEPVTNNFTHDSRIISKVNWIHEPVVIQLR